MIKQLALASVLLLSACTTAQVTVTCNEVSTMLSDAAPILQAAPSEIQMAVWAISLGTAACGSPEYAAARDLVIAWLRPYLSAPRPI